MEFHEFCVASKSSQQRHSLLALEMGSNFLGFSHENCNVRWMGSARETRRHHINLLHLP